MNTTNRNSWLRNHHYRWRKDSAGQWFLIGPDGYPTSEREAIRAIEQQRQTPPPSPQQWAQSMQEKCAFLLDTETSGLEPHHEVIELALLDMDGAPVLNTLIQCQEPIPPDATRIHGITNAMVASAPTFPEVWAQLTPYLDREIVIYNAAFDVPLLAQTAARHGLTLPRLKSHCLMIQYLAYATQAQHNGKSRESYRSLEAACHHFGIPTGGHRALTDAQAARGVLRHLATY